MALDNPWGAGIAFAPFETGVDISVHALTKHSSRGADVLMGSVITRDAGIQEWLLQAWLDLGMGWGRTIFLLFLAEWTGLEPATPGVTGRHSLPDVKSHATRPVAAQQWRSIDRRTTEQL